MNFLVILQSKDGFHSKIDCSTDCQVYFLVHLNDHKYLSERKQKQLN